jgi:hypothetical protein
VELKNFGGRRRSTRKRVRGFLLIAGIFWGLGVCAGMGWLARYSLTAAPPGEPSHLWAGSLSSGKHSTLVMSIHAYCPCSAASLEELSRVLAKTGDRLSVHILFYEPSIEPGWQQTSLWKKASSLPGVDLVNDPDLKKIRQFGLATSGETALYDSNGKLVFHGGITRARGHVGDNEGATNVVDFVNTGHLARLSTPVFGCSLLSYKDAPPPMDRSARIQ